ncbi:MAG: hypothetical protein ABUL73_03660 [Alphaproteobacteria bacterium]
MDHEAKKLRDWGVVASGAVILVSLGFALFGGASPKAQPAPQPVVSMVNAAPAAQPVPASQPPLSFTVRFAPEHPMAQAEAFQAQGRAWEAHAEAERILTQRRDLIGLCFDRFTPNAEIVLKPCQEAARNRQAAAQRYWLARFQAMPGVSYVQANMSLRRAAAD